jgi:hypothetical protein
VAGLSSDNDPLYRFHQWQANLRILEVTEIKSLPYVPLSHPFVERLIGTLRREYLDHMLFWTTVDLENKLLDFRTYFNHHRTHTSREGRTPDPPPSRLAANLRSFRWQPHCRALYHTRGCLIFQDSRSLRYSANLGKTSKKSFGVSRSQRGSRLRSFHCHQERPKMRLSPLSQVRSAIITSKNRFPVTIGQIQARLRGVPPTARIFVFAFEFPPQFSLNPRQM